MAPVRTHQKTQMLQLTRRTPPRGALRYTGAFAVAAILAFPSACSDAQNDVSAETSGVVVRDSAGVEIVENAGADQPLAWEPVETARIGGQDSGPEAFFRVRPTGVTTDAGEIIYLLDSGNLRLQAFRADGSHLWSAGSPGEGPGEFGSPGLVTVSEDHVLVHDGRRGTVIRFDAEGSLVDETPIRGGPTHGPGFPQTALLTDGTLLARVTETDSEQETRSWALLAIRGERQDTLLYETQGGYRRTEAEFCGALGGIAFVGPALSGSPAWDANAERAAWVGPWVDYSIRAFDASTDPGAPGRIIRRDRPPLVGTRELAIASYERSWVEPIRTEDGAVCEPDFGAWVDASGFRTEVQRIGDLRVDPEARIWAIRETADGGPDGIDVFAPDGTYRGTLPVDFPIPLAFLDGDRFVTLETDEWDLQYVVVYRIDRAVGAP